MKAVFTDFPLKQVIITVTQSTGFERPIYIYIYNDYQQDPTMDIAWVGHAEMYCLLQMYNKAHLFKAILTIAEPVLFLAWLWGDRNFIADMTTFEHMWQKDIKEMVDGTSSGLVDFEEKSSSCQSNRGG